MPQNQSVDGVQDGSFHGRHREPASAGTADRYLANALRAWNIDFIGPTSAPAAQASARPDAKVLIEQLARSSDPRMRTALAILFVRNPSLAALVPVVVDGIPDAAADVLRTHYTAAVYLQRLWRPRLDLYLKGSPILPDYFSGQMRLPGPDVRHGKVGLTALTGRSSHNLWASYDSMMRLLFDQLRRDRNRELKTAR